MENKTELMSLKTQVENTDIPPPRQTDKMPLLGLFAVGFAVLGIFTHAVVFVPLGLILGVVALFLGQIGLGLLAIGLAVIGVLTSPSLLMMIGLGTWLVF